MTIPLTRASTASALLLCVGLAACGAERAPTTNPVDLSLLPGLCQRVDRLIEVLERAHPAAVGSATATPVEVQTLRTSPRDDSLHEASVQLRERVAALEAELAILRSRAFAGAGGAVMPRPAVIEPMRAEPVQELGRMLGDGERGRGAALEAVLLLQPSEVLARYGMPSEVFTDESGGVHWVYQHGEHTVRMLFANGVVMLVR